MSPFKRRLVVSSPVAVFALGMLGYNVATHYQRAPSMSVYVACFAVALVAMFALGRLLPRDGAK